MRRNNRTDGNPHGFTGATGSYPDSTRFVDQQSRNWSNVSFCSVAPDSFRCVYDGLNSFLFVHDQFWFTKFYCVDSISVFDSLRKEFDEK